VLRKVFALALTLVLFGAVAIDARGSLLQGANGTPSAATPFDCATPVAQASGTPIKVVTAASAAASPGGAQPGDLIGLYPCGTPIGKDANCATPVDEPTGTPIKVVTAPSEAAPPGGAEPGEKVGVYPCGSPDVDSK